MDKITNQDQLALFSIPRLLWVEFINACSNLLPSSWLALDQNVDLEKIVVSNTSSPIVQAWVPPRFVNIEAAVGLFMGQNSSGDRIYLALDPYAMDAKFMTPDVVYLVMHLLLEMQEYSGSVTIENYKEVFAELQSKCDNVNLRPNDTHIDHVLSKRKKLGTRGFPSSNLPTVDPCACFYRSHIYALDEPIGAHNQLKPGYIAICPKRVSVLPYALCVDLCNHLQGLCNVVGGTAFGRHVLEIFMWRSGAELCQKHSVVQHRNYLLNLTSNGGWTENMDEAIAMENVLNPYFVKMFC